METVHIMLACGGGASSGFLASSMRKAAKKQGINADIIARSETEIDDYKHKIDILLIGPHLKYIEDKIQKVIEGTNVKMAFIDDYTYGTLDGESALALALSLEGK